MPLTFTAINLESWKDNLVNGEAFLVGESPGSIGIGSKSYPYFPVIHVVDVSAYKDFDHDFMAELVLVAPRAVPAERRESIRSGVNAEEDWPRGDYIQQAYLLAECGCSASIEYRSGDDVEAIVAELQAGAETLCVMVGFYLDKPVNRVGLRGWDAIRGEFRTAREKQLERKRNRARKGQTA